MVKCSYTGKKIQPGSGKMYVLDSGQVLHFKSSKEEKNMLKLGRNPRKCRWSTFFEKVTLKKKENKKN